MVAADPARDGSISSGGMFSPKVRDNLAAILRLRTISSSAVNTSEAGEFRLMPEVGVNGEFNPGIIEAAPGSRTISTGRELRRDDLADAASAEEGESELEGLVDEPLISALSGVSPRIDSTLRVDRTRRARCA